MNSNKNVVAEFKNKFGETRVIHNTRHGLTVRREKSTLIYAINPVVCGLVGEKIKSMRVAKGYTLEQLCTRAGLQSVNPKARMWEIENNSRPNGVRLGTLYAIATALDVEIADLLPTAKEIVQKTGMKLSTDHRLVAGKITG